MEDLLMRNRIRNILQSQILGGCDMSGCALTGGRKKRGPSAYNKFVGRKVKEGHTMKEAIKLWRQSSGYKKKSGKRRSKKGSALSGGEVVRDMNACVEALLNKHPLLTEKQAKQVLKEYFLYDSDTGECGAKDFILPAKWDALLNKNTRVLARDVSEVGLTKQQLKKKRTLNALQRKLKSSKVAQTDKGLKALLDEVEAKEKQVQKDPATLLKALLNE